MHLLEGVAPTLTLERTKGVPLYVQIRESPRGMILDGSIPVGQQLPGEMELARQYGVSRMTLRQAIDDLVQEGHLHVLHGRGTIVASRKMERNYARLTGFYEDALARNLTPSSRLVSREVVSASQDVASRLALQAGDPVIHFVRQRLTEGQIVSLNDVYCPHELCHWLASEDLEAQSLYELYEVHGLRLDWAQQTVEARGATKTEGALLDIEPGSPVLYMERTTYSVGNLPIEWARSISPTGALSLEMTLHR